MSSTPIAESQNDERSGIGSASFFGLLITQLLTAINDNVFRWLAVGVGKDYFDQKDHNLILMAGTACFVLPYLLLAAHAGYLADRFPKRNVIVACKVAEVVIMGLGIVAILVHSWVMLFVVVGLMGAQSALFSPAKLGTIPEILKEESISNANGLFGLCTVAATVVGMAVGSGLTDLTGDRGTNEYWWVSAVTLLGLALVGTAFSLMVKKVQAANVTKKFPWFPPAQTMRDLAALWRNRALFRVALGLVFFWSVGALAQMNIDQFSFEGGAANESDKTPLLAALVIGVGLGSVLAGIASQGRVELGILPLGALGVAFSAMMLFTVQGVIIDPAGAVTGMFLWACFLLFLLGSSAGLFSVPLEAFMQHRSPIEQRGSILAATNFLVFLGVLISSLLFAGLRAPLFSEEPMFSSRSIFLLSGLATLPVLAYILFLIPQATIRFVVWLTSITLYRIRVFGKENLPEQGGALLTPNHISWLDGVLLLLTSSRPIRMIVWAGNFNNRVLLWMGRLFGAILIEPKPKAIVAALNEAGQALKDGELVCIFPEGAISRSGQLQPFKPGMMKILRKADVPVIPVYLDELWGSIFSFRGGKFFWKWPSQWPYPISIHFGKPQHQPKDVHEVRQAVEQLGAQAVKQRMERSMLLTRAFIQQCKARKRTAKIADSTGEEHTGGSLLMRTLILRRLLRRHVLSDDEQNVGILLPPSNGGVIVNAALTIDRRTTVNLNYTVTSEVLNFCIKQAGLKHVLTSRKVIEKLKLELDAEVVYLEDYREKVTLADKISAALATYAMPSSQLERSLRLGEVNNDDVMTIIFTSGSTGQPKGVMLTYGNVASNAQAIDQVVHLEKHDVVLGLLPFFHSMGFTVTLWTVLAIDIRGVYHFNPLDARQVGKLCGRHNGTVLIGTPTFLRGYLRRCEKEDFDSLEVVVAGAEKLPVKLSDAFEEKFGTRPVEGYGATELSPLVSVNVPPARQLSSEEITLKEGSVGRPVPGVSAKVVDPETFADRPVGESGMLLVQGPNVMKGYLGREDLTEKVMRDGWYVTGDIALIDDDGFIFITGRESRFSKIGGEMVPHVMIEESLIELLGDGDEETVKIAVTAVPDWKKGERIIVIHTEINKSSDELRKGLQELGLPNIYIPSSDSFLQIEELPVLGTGKLDLKAIAKIAADAFGE